MAQSFNTLGNLALRQKDYKTAITYYQRSLAIRRKLCEQSPRLDWARNLGYSLSNVAQASWKDGQTQAAHQYSSERLKLAEELLNQDPSDANLHSDYANALFHSADILLNGKDPAVQDWPAALELARYAVARTARRDPRLLALLAQALRLNKLPVEALATVEEAAKLLPPPEKRTGNDALTAEEIDFELSRSKVAARGRPNAKAQSSQKHSQ
jgi:tetratricopeptide (TPR) repeat protein